MARKHITCVRSHEEEYVHTCFKTNTALKKWVESEGLQFQTWKHEGKKQISKFDLEKKGVDDPGIEFNVDYNIPLLSKKDII